MLRKLPTIDDPVFASVPVLDEEFSSEDFHPAVFEPATLKYLAD